MTESFKKKIKDMNEKGVELFYAGKGRPEAFKFSVRHISTASKYGLGFVVSNEFIPHSTIHLVDFDKETITETSKRIPSRELKELE